MHTIPSLLQYLISHSLCLLLRYAGVIPSPPILGLINYIAIIWAGVYSLCLSKT